MNLLTLLILFPLLLPAQTENEWKIRILQDKRIERSEELFGFLRSDNARERELALLAFANIQDTSAVDEILPLLGDGAANVRSMAAFALGMIGNSAAAPILMRRLAVETNDRSVAEILNAIGMCGTEDDLKKMIAQAEYFKPQWKTDVAAAVMRFANRRITEPSATRYIVTLLSDKESQLNAVYTLMRIADTTIIRKNADQIEKLLVHVSPLIRMWSAAVAGAAGTETATAKLISMAQKDRDWRVRVQSIRSLRKMKKLKNEIIALFADANEHVALTAVAAYETLTADELSFAEKQKFTTLLASDRYFVSVKEEIRKIAARRMGEEAMPLLGDWRSGTPHISAQRLRAYGETGSPKALLVAADALQRSEHSLVTIAALEAYQSLARRSDDLTKRDFLKKTVLLFGKKDAGISYSAAIAFQDTSFSKELRRIFLSALVSEYRQMSSAADLEPMVELMTVFAEIGDSTALPVIEPDLANQDKVIRTAAEKAYMAVTGKESPVRFVKNPESYKPFYTAAHLPLLSKYKGAEIITAKGTIRILFDKTAAPFTVLNFILLAEKKFYDGLSFHRVVSNFVIQGGDPLGNGSGGPNYAIRTEVSPYAKYRTGAVGMASAGRDTEGSQWFVTHCPTPHLDYRYSIFAYTKDAPVVNRIMAGDRIEKVKLLVK